MVVFYLLLPRQPAFGHNWLSSRRCRVSSMGKGQELIVTTRSRWVGNRRKQPTADQNFNQSKDHVAPFLRHQWERSVAAGCRNLHRKYARRCEKFCLFVCFFLRNKRRKCGRHMEGDIARNRAGDVLLEDVVLQEVWGTVEP